MLSAVPVLETYLPTPGPMLQVVTQKRRELEDRYLLALSARQRGSGSAPRERTEHVVARARRQELAASANFLELCLVAAGLVEATCLIGAVTPEELRAKGLRLIDVCTRVTGLDPRPVLMRNQRLLQDVEQQNRSVDTLPPAENVLERMTQIVRGVTAACPIRALEQWGHELDAAEFSHRCRKAYEGLIAFARRYAPELDEQMRTVGRAYAEGRLSLDDVSRILQVSPQDAVALLEKYSFCRSLDAITIEPSRRRQRLRAIADEICDSSKAQNPPLESLLDRDVIASQRIEGVDAHPWLAHRGG